jgi:small subunit ribosomal protein S6
MRRYETTYILRPNLGEDQFSEVIERTNNIITADGGAVINLERWGNRKLAYEIKKESLGQYVYVDYAAPGSAIQEIERIFRIDDRVLRFLTVKLSDSIDAETISRETERAAELAAEKEAETAETTETVETTETETADMDEAEENDDDSSEEKEETNVEMTENAEVEDKDNEE